MLIHFLLLDRVANQDCRARKTGLAGGVLRMEVRSSQEELLIPWRESGGHSRGGGSVPRPMPVSTTSVARLPTTMAMLGKPMSAQTWSEIFVVFSPTIGWLICAKALPAVSSIKTDFMELF